MSTVPGSQATSLHGSLFHISASVVNRPSKVNLLFWCCGTRWGEVNPVANRIRQWLNSHRRESRRDTKRSKGHSWASPSAQSNKVMCNWWLICSWGKIPQSHLFFWNNLTLARLCESGISPLKTRIMGQNNYVPKHQKQAIFISSIFYRRKFTQIIQWWSLTISTMLGEQLSHSWVIPTFFQILITHSVTTTENWSLIH